jgi:hypothetical protein
MAKKRARSSFTCKDKKGEGKMIGISIIVLIVLYLFVSFKGVEYIYDKSQKKRYAILATLFFILLPTWDVIIGKIYFDHLCKTEGGLKVYKNVQADGFLDTSAFLNFRKSSRIFSDDIENARRFLDYGFKFYETSTSDGKFVHFSKDDSGKVIYEIRAEPKSKYEYVVYEKDKIVSYVLGIQKVREKLFRDIQNKKIAVQSIWFTRDGWVGRIMKHFIGMVICQQFMIHRKENV